MRELKLRRRERIRRSDIALCFVAWPRNSSSNSWRNLSNSSRNARVARVGCRFTDLLAMFTFLSSPGWACSLKYTRFQTWRQELKTVITSVDVPYKNSRGVFSPPSSKVSSACLVDFRNSIRYFMLTSMLHSFTVLLTFVIGKEA